MSGWSCSSTEWGFSKRLVLNLTRWTGLLSSQKTDDMAKGCRHQEQTCCSHIYTVLKHATNNHTDRDTHNLPAWMHISLLTLVVYCRSSDDLLHVWDDPKLTSHSVVDVQVMSGLLRVMRVLELLDWMSFWRMEAWSVCLLCSSFSSLSVSAQCRKEPLFLKSSCSWG